MNHLVCKMLENSHSSPEWFGLTNSPKCQNIQFTMIQNKEKWQILTLEKLKQANVFHFCLMYD